MRDGFVIPSNRLGKSRQIRPIRHPIRTEPNCILALLPEENNFWLDRSGKNDHGVINGATWVSKGNQGPALNFDGISNTVRCSVDGLNVPNGTICAWIRKNADSAQYRGPWGKDSAGLNKDISVSFEGVNQVLHFLIDNGVGSTSIVSDNELDNTWYFIAVVFGSGGIKMYVNGILQANTSGFSTNVDNASPFILGARRSDGLYFNGMISMVLAFNTVLTGARIRAIHENNK